MRLSGLGPSDRLINGIPKSTSNRSMAGMDSAPPALSISYVEPLGGTQAFRPGSGIRLSQCSCALLRFIGRPPTEGRNPAPPSGWRRSRTRFAASPRDQRLDQLFQRFSLMRSGSSQSPKPSAHIARFVAQTSSTGTAILSSCSMKCATRCPCILSVTPRSLITEGLSRSSPKSGSGRHATPALSSPPMNPWHRR